MGKAWRFRNSIDRPAGGDGSPIGTKPRLTERERLSNLPHRTWLLLIGVYLLVGIPAATAYQVIVDHNLWWEAVRSATRLVIGLCAGMFVLRPLAARLLLWAWPPKAVCANSLERRGEPGGQREPFEQR